MAAAIPQELVEDIVANLPVKSVLRFSSVSTSWRDLIRKPSFTSLHSLNSKTKIIVNSPHRPDCFNVISRHGGNRARHQHVTCPVAIRRDAKPTFTIVDSCNGLVCVTSTSTTSSRQIIYICNPATRESRFVPPRPRSHYDYKDDLRFAFDAASNDYNIVSVGDGDPFLGASGIIVQIYSLQADRWRLVDNVQTPESLRRDMNSFNTLTTGILSWLIKTRNMIVMFDASTVSSHETVLPDLGPDGYLSEVMTLDGSLAILARRDKVNEVWVLSEIGVEKSWSKRFCINQNVANPLGFWSDYGLVFEGSNGACFSRVHEVAVYVFGEERVKSLEILGGLSESWGRRNDVQVVNYKETLVSPKMSLKRKSAC